jgi:hypothetical protein
VRGDESLLPSLYGTYIQVFIPANYTDFWGATSTHEYWSSIGNGSSSTPLPGNAGVVFNGFTSQTETRIYRAVFIDKNGVAHHSSAFQIN